MNTRKYIIISMLVAQALVLFIIENMIPTPFLPPGAKLGLTNIITVLAIYAFSTKEAVLIIVLRVVLSGILVSNPQTMVYSFSGAISSLIFMLIIKNTLKDNVSAVGVSCVGSFFHNVGQLLVASLMFGSFGFFYLLPLNSIIAIITGTFIGFTSLNLLKYLRKLKFFKDI